MKRTALLPFISLVIALGAFAQETRRSTNPPSVSEILWLHSAGFRTEELTTLLDRNGTPAVTREDVKKLTDAGVPEPIVARLSAAVEKTATTKLDVEDILNLTSSGVPDSQIIGLIAASENTFQLATDQWLNLMQRGVSPAVVRALREKSMPGSRSGADTKPAAITLDDITRIAREGATGDEIVRRIRASESRFDITVDQLVVLSRQGVPKEALKEVWARRSVIESQEPRVVAAPSGETAAAASKPTGQPEPPRADVVLHMEDSGGFSMLAPGSFRVHRETRGANALLSFVLGEPEGASNMAPAELSVFRYRSSTPERLTAENLPAIADNFFARLQASYVARKLTVAFGRPTTTKIAGQPALEASVTTSAPDGTTHRGVAIVTFGGEQIFVISTAVRTDQMREHESALTTCMHSFAMITRKSRPESGTTDNERLTGLVAAWREAVQNRDFALYDSLFAAPGRAQARREAFVALCDKAADPILRLSTGPISIDPTGAAVSMRLLGGEKPQSIDLKFTRDGQSFALAE